MTDFGGDFPIGNLDVNSPYQLEYQKCSDRSKCWTAWSDCTVEKNQVDSCNGIGVRSRRRENKFDHEIFDRENCELEVVEFCTTSKPHLLTISELSKIPEIATSKLEITDKIRLIGEDTTAIPKISDTAVAEVFDLELVTTDSISNTAKDIVVSESTMLEEENSKEIGSAINLSLEFSLFSNSTLITYV